MVAEFIRPASGLIEVTVCAKSGLLPTKYCNEGTVRELFLAGTEPREFCDLHRYEAERNVELRENLKEALLLGDTLSQDFTVPDIGADDLLSPGDVEGSSGSGGDLGGGGAAGTSDDMANPLLD